MKQLPVILLLGFGLCVSLQAQPRSIDAGVRGAMDALSVDSLWRHAARLADDAFEGRGTGERGGRLAARYLAEELRRIGAVPLDADSSYMQQVPMHGSRPLPRSRLLLAHPEQGEVLLGLGTDYLLYKGGAQTFIPRPLRMVFVGYGIVAPEYDYNDYQNVDVADAIVVFLSGEPESEDPDYFLGRRNTIYSIPEMKQRIAFSRGARGSVMLPLPRSDGAYSWEDWQRIFAFEDVSLPIMVPSHLSALMRLETAATLFDGSGYSLDDVLEMDALHRIRSFPLRTQLSFTGVFDERDFLAPNIVGLLPGSDPMLRDSYLLLSAHYDHLGVGPVVHGDSIYNGFVDNALGTAAVLELARVFSDPGHRPKRSIVLLLTTAEEKGLVGSQYYSAQPMVPLHKTIANVNIDGLAIIDTFDDVVGVGGEYSTLQRHLERIASELGMTVSALPEEVDIMEAFASSDQSAFALAGIPSILLMEGRKYRNLGPEEGFRRFLEWGRTRYHSPFDDTAQPVDRDALLQHLGILAAYVAGVANTFEPPQWIRGSKYINARLQSLAEER
jgi:hypothetical protein